MVLLERPLMADNATELPQFSRFILDLSKVVHELIVCYNIFKLIIIHRYNKLHMIKKYEHGNGSHLLVCP
jgi:hypothetical protein